ncbi:adenosine kinase [Candidatus Magnetaquicoccus inordinatus]|uniref:adenosine kinase n=1 Tax=Candidatus Magnetaquicoccus inordinatus TaxID=2496818 RepID=UPI00102C64F6|nr:adenosine kinase [Candidatus Magnetaquicoccus inordinatus]
MKRYDVYGIGHALVDMEFQVDDTFLIQAGLQKGSMTLVDETRQQQLLQQLHGLACHRACGGSAANTLIGLAQFGGRGFYSCQVAQDEAGDFFAQAMRSDGVDNQLDPPRPLGTTGRCLVFITPDAERTMCTHLGISEQFSSTQLAPDVLAQAEYLYIEGYLVSSPSGREATVAAARLARQQKVKTALTFSDTSMITYFRSGLEAITELGLDLLFCNESEAMAFTGCQTLGEAQRQLSSLAQLVGLTLGGRGAAIGYQGEWIEIPALPVQAIDSNGAGDLFAGALLYGITHGMTLQQAGHLACRASAQLVTQAGARLKAGQARTILNQQEH